MNRRVIVDPLQLNKYIDSLCSTIEEFFVIDIEKCFFTTLFYVANKYSPFDDLKEAAIETVIKQFVYSEDRAAVEAILTQKVLLEVAKSGVERQIEFRSRCENNVYSWVRGFIMPTGDGDLGHVLFYTVDIAKEKRAVEVEQMQKEILAVLKIKMMDYFEVDLAAKCVKVVLCTHTALEDGRVYGWDDWYDCFRQHILYSGDMQKFETAFALTHLQQLKDQERINITVRYAIDANEYIWVEFNGLYVVNRKGEKHVCIIIHNIHKQHLVEGIVNLYINENCDYFYYINAKENTGELFNARKTGTIVPPMVVKDYAQEMVAYINQHVVEEDRAMVAYEIGLERIISQLDKKGIHTFSAGIQEIDGSYARKLWQFLYHDKDNQVILLTRTDITDFYSEQQELRKRAQLDALTGIYNVSIKTMIRKELLTRDEQAAVLFMDLDNFKVVNDTLGHARGDSLLCAVAEVIKQNTRQNDLCGRIGGDEFVVFLNVACCEEALKEIVERIQQEINDMIVYHVGELEVSCSIGVACYPKDGKRFEDLLKHADTAVYQAKQEGKNRIVFYSDLPPV